MKSTSEPCETVVFLHAAGRSAPEATRGRTRFLLRLRWQLSLGWNSWRYFLARFEYLQARYHRGGWDPELDRGELEERRRHLLSLQERVEAARQQLRYGRPNAAALH